MKNFFALGALCTTTLLMTSCLDSSGNNETTGTTPGVVEFNAKLSKNVVYYNDYEFLYTDKVANDPSIERGTCIFLGYKLNYDAPENVDAVKKGYYTALATNIAPLNNYESTPHLTDTATLLPNEIAISNLDNSEPNNAWALIRSNLFINTYHKDVLTGMKSTFNMSYDAAADPVQTTGKRIYNLYLRMQVTDKGKSPMQSIISVSTYNIDYFMQELVQRERAEGYSEVYFSINYINHIDEKTKKLSWYTTEPYTYKIPKEGER